MSAFGFKSRRVVGLRGLAVVSSAVVLGLVVRPAHSAPPEPPCPLPVAPVDAKAPGSPPVTGSGSLTGFEFRIVSASDVILVGTAKVVSSVTIKGTTVARVDVERVLKGQAEASFTLFVGGPRNTDDPKRPSTPYVGTTARRSVLFLRSTPNGSGLALDTLFSVDDLDGQEKLEVLEKELAVFALTDGAARKRDTLALLMSFVAGDRPWTRTHGIRELESLSRRAPDAFDDVSLDRLDTLRQGIRDRSERAVLSATLDRLDPDRARRTRGAAVPAPTEPTAPLAPIDAPMLATETRAYLRMKKRFATATDDDTRTGALSEMARLAATSAAPDLVAAFADPATAVRERAAVLLADIGADAEWPTLRTAFDAEKEPSVREALLRASGFLGTAADVDWVLRVSVGTELRRARCFALARLRTPAALAALALEGETAGAATPPDTTTASLVEYLAGPAFPKSDPALRRRALATETNLPPTTLPPTTLPPTTLPPTK